MKYTVKVSGFYPEQFATLKAARNWARSCPVSTEKPHYSITRCTGDDPAKQLVESGELKNGRLVTRPLMIE